MATDDMAGTDGRFDTGNYDYFLLRRDLAEAVDKPTVLHEFPSAPLKPVKKTGIENNTEKKKVQI